MTGGHCGFSVPRAKRENVSSAIEGENSRFSQRDTPGTCRIRALRDRERRVAQHHLGRPRCSATEIDRRWSDPLKLRLSLRSRRLSFEYRSAARSGVYRSVGRRLSERETRNATRGMRDRVGEIVPGSLIDFVLIATFDPSLIRLN